MRSGKAQTTLLGVWHGTEKASQKIENSDKKVVCYHDKNPMQKQNDRVFKDDFIKYFLWSLISMKEEADIKLEAST